MKYKLCYYLISSSLCHQLACAPSSFILSWKAVFSLCFDIFIYSSMMSQSITPPAPAPASNILALIQLCCLCCVHQVACLADACNVTNVCQCDYCCLLNKLCHPVSSMQDIEELLMLRRFHQTSMLLSITFYVKTVTSIIRWCLKVTATAMLCFIMQCKGPSPVSFKLTKLLLWSAVKLHLWCVCISQL